MISLCDNWRGAGGGPRWDGFSVEKPKVLEDFCAFRLISVKTASGRDFGAIWARFGSPLVAPFEVFAGSFWGSIPGLACKTVSKVILEPFGGGKLGGKVSILRGRGAKSQQFRLFALEPVSGALPASFWSRLGAQVGAKIASQTAPRKTREHKTP